MSGHGRWGRRVRRLTLSLRDQVARRGVCCCRLGYCESALVGGIFRCFVILTIVVMYGSGFGFVGILLVL